MREPVEDAALRAEPIEWVIQDTLAAGCVYILAGRAKVARKTLTCMDMGRAVCSGTPFHGLQTFTRPVIYTMLEDGQARARRRAAMMGFGTPTWQPGNFMFEYEIEDYENTMRQLQNGDIRNSLWLIDSLPEVVGYLGMDENSAPEMTRLIRAHRKVAQESNTTVLFIHHLNKGGETMRGSTALEAAGDGYAEAKPEQTGPGVKITWTLRDGANQIFLVDLARTEDGFFFFRQIDPEEARQHAEVTVENEVEAFMAQIGFDEGVSTSDIAQGVNDRRNGSGKPVSKEAVRQARRRLIERGALFEGKKSLTYRDRTWWATHRSAV